MSHSRMMAEHFGISILESDAKLLHERVQLLITEAYNRGMRNERESIAALIEDAPPLVDFVQNDMNGCMVCGFTPKLAAEAIRARGEA